MSLDKALKNIRFDKRLTEIHINRGVLTKEELEKYLKELPDLSHNVEMASGDEDDSDSDSDVDGSESDDSTDDGDSTDPVAH